MSGHRPNSSLLFLFGRRLTGFFRNAFVAVAAACLLLAPAGCRREAEDRHQGNGGKPGAKAADSVSTPPLTSDLLLSGSPVRAGSYPGGALLVSSREVRAYFPPQGDSVPVSRITGAVRLPHQQVPPIPMERSLNDQYLSATFPADLHPPVPVEFRLRVSGGPEELSTVTLTEIRGAFEDRTGAVSAAEKESTATAREQLRAYLPKLEAAMESGDGEKVAQVAIQMSALADAFVAGLPDPARAAAEEPGREFKELVSMIVNAARDRKATVYRGAGKTMRDRTLPRLLEAGGVK